MRSSAAPAPGTGTSSPNGGRPARPRCCRHRRRQAAGARGTPVGADARLSALLLAVEAQGLHHRRVAEAEQEGRAIAGVDVLAEGPGRHSKDVLVLPVQPPAAHDRVAGALDRVVVRAADPPESPRLLTGTQ